MYIYIGKFYTVCNYDPLFEVPLVYPRAEKIRIPAGTRTGGRGYGRESVPAGTGAGTELCPVVLKMKNVSNTKMEKMEIRQTKKDLKLTWSNKFCTSVLSTAFFLLKKVHS